MGDCNLYTFDMRNLSKALQLHWDHVMAVLDVHFSPTGHEFVSCSYDATVRLWQDDSQRSRDIYHTKRMQRVLCCHYTPDSKFVLSGSEDTNIRVWKARSDEKLGVLDPQERHARAYRDSLKEKFSRLSEVRRIKRSVHVPKSIKKATQTRRVIRDAKWKKARNVEQHSKPGSVTHVPRKKQHVVK